MTNDGTQDLSESYTSDPTTQTTKLERQAADIVDDIWGCPGGEHLKSHVDDITALIQSEASRIALEAIDNTSKPCLTCEGRGYNWKDETSYNLREKPSVKCPTCDGTGQALTAPEGGKHE